MNSINFMNISHILMQISTLKSLKLNLSFNNLGSEEEPPLFLLKGIKKLKDLTSFSLDLS